MYPIRPKNRQTTLRLTLVFLVTMLVFGLTGISKASTRTIAILPMEDLSKGQNSPNWKLTRYLVEALSLKGLKVITENDVISFMAAERVRWLGYLETAHVLKAKNALDKALNNY